MSRSEETLEDISALRDLLVRLSPPDWQKFGAHGFVLYGNTEEDERFLFRTTRAWAEEGFAWRAPHHTVGFSALEGEVRRAMGGLIILAELSLFSTSVLRKMSEMIVRDRIPVNVIGFDYFEPGSEFSLDEFSARMRHQAHVLGLQLVTMDELGEPTAEAEDVSGELDAINRHRRSMGMSRLDPEASGWTVEDVRLEAERIERLPNPLVDMKRELLRCQNDQGKQVGLFGKKQAEVEGFALVGQRGKVRARSGPGRGTQEDLVSRKVSAEKMLEMRERELAERAAKKSKRKRKKNPERWLAPKLSPAERLRLKQLHDVYFDLFEQLESLPGATLTTPTGEYVVPEGYALLYRVGETDYLFFQDEAPDETWSFISVGRYGRRDTVEHLEDYLAVLERVNHAVVIEVDGPGHGVSRGGSR